MHRSRLAILAAGMAVAAALGGCAGTDQRLPPATAPVVPETPAPDSAAADRERVEYVQRALRGAAATAPAGRRERSTGSGFFISPLLVLTNYHVVAGCPVLTLQSGTGSSTAAPAALLVADQTRDLALIKSSAAAPSFAGFEADLRHADGSDLSIVGFPLHGMVLRQPNVVPAETKPAALVSDRALYQISADVHPGHSGSPLLDEYGSVVGVVTVKVDTVATYQRTGMVVKNVAFAIPNATVGEFLRRNHVTFRADARSRSLTPDERLELARDFIVQISCWE